MKFTMFISSFILLLAVGCINPDTNKICPCYQTVCLKVQINGHECPDPNDPEARIFTASWDSSFVELPSCDTTWFQQQTQLGWNNLVNSAIKRKDEKAADYWRQNRPTVICTDVIVPAGYDVHKF